MTQPSTIFRKTSVREADGIFAVLFLIGIPAVTLLAWWAQMGRFNSQICQIGSAPTVVSGSWQLAFSIAAFVAAGSCWIWYRNAGTGLGANWNAVGSMVFSALIMHFGGGSGEAHFPFFVFISFLIFYRDWRPIALACVVISAHHIAFFALQGMGVPVVLFNCISVGTLVAHLVVAAVQGVVLGFMAEQMAKLHNSNVQFNELLEEKVAHRTAELEFANRLRMRDEESLHASEQLNRQLFESSRDALLLLSPPAWQFTGANQAALDLFGVPSVAEFVQFGPWDVSPERQPNGHLTSDMAKQAIETAMVSGSNFFEWTHQKLDGTPFFADVLLTRIEVGSKVFLQATVRDISERQRAQAEIHQLNAKLEDRINISQHITRELQHSQLLLQTAQKAAGLGHYVIDVHASTWTNDAIFDGIFGIDSRFERTFANWHRLMPAEDRQRVIERHQESIANQEASSSAEYRITRPCDGKTVWIAAWAHSIFDSNGNPLRAGLVQDITERKLVMETLMEKNIELERYTRMVSHDLKSPLVTIKTFMAYLQQDLERGDAVRIEKDIGFVTKAADRMGQLLDELLEMSRIGRVASIPQHVTLHEVVKDAMNINAGAIAQRGVTVQIEGDDVKLFGDRTRLVQVWQNLIDNAVKFMGEQPKPHIRIGMEGNGNQIVFYVADNGIGVEPAYHQKIFGMFEKLDSAVPGSGLGLALVKRIVQLHHGEIHIESSGTGQGSRFRFTLPEVLKMQPTGGGL